MITYSKYFKLNIHENVKNGKFIWFSRKPNRNRIIEKMSVLPEIDPKYEYLFGYMGVICVIAFSSLGAFYTVGSSGMVLTNWAKLAGGGIFSLCFIRPTWQKLIAGAIASNCPSLVYSCIVWSAGQNVIYIFGQLTWSSSPTKRPSISSTYMWFGNSTRGSASVMWLYYWTVIFDRSERQFNYWKI